MTPELSVNPEVSSPEQGDRQRKRFRARGFSMVELMVVAATAVILGAIAIPIVDQGLQQYRMSSAATSVANLIQRTRYESIRQNTTISCRYQQQGNNWVMWIDLNGNGVMDPTEPQIVLPSDAQMLQAGVAPGPGSMGAAYTNAIPPPKNGNTYAIALDSRGTVNFTGGPAIYVIYLGSAALGPTEGYKAVTLTPTGRTKVWSASYNGNWYVN
jgi:type II secretory pathway pseudopilin PulG